MKVPDILDIAKVNSVNLGAVALSYTSLLLGLKYLGVILGVAYTIWKWTTDYKDRKYGQRNKSNSPDEHCCKSRNLDRNQW